MSPGLLLNVGLQPFVLNAENKRDSLRFEFSFLINEWSH